MLNSSSVILPRTLFKFVKKLEEALSAPCAPSLVEEGSGAQLDSVDDNPEQTPIQRVHLALKSALPGRGRELQARQRYYIHVKYSVIYHFI